MKKQVQILIIITLVMLLASCSASRQGAQEEGLVLTRKYVGSLIDHRIVKGEGLLDPDIVWLKTDMEATYGKIAIYVSGDLKLQPQERLYIRRIHSGNPGMNQYNYYLEPDDGHLFYRLHSFRKDEKTILPQEVF